MLAFGCERPQASPPTATANGSRVCVDSQGRQVPDAQCRDDRPRSFYHWYHVSHGGSFVPIGGGRSSSPGSVSHPSSVTRGGFGSSAPGGGGGGRLEGVSFPPPPNRPG